MTIDNPAVLRIIGTLEGRLEIQLGRYMEDYEAYLAVRKLLGLGPPQSVLPVPLNKCNHCGIRIPMNRSECSCCEDIINEECR